MAAQSLIWLWLFSPSMLLFLLLINAKHCSAFQSDELILEDDEEWGLVGSRPTDQLVRQITDPEGSEPFQSATARPGVSADVPKVVFALEQAFGDSNFSIAGVFTARVRMLPQGGQTITKLRLAREKFTTEWQNAFEDILKEDGFYKIRFPSNVINPGQGSVLSSVKARCLSAANLQERFDIYMDKGNVIGVGYGAADDCTYPRILKYPAHWSFESHIVLKSGEQAMRIAVVSDDLDTINEDGETKKPPERSFWAKYWMYVVPLGLIVLNVVTQVANMPDEQTANQGGAQVATQRAATAGARRR